jgi:hypothetical protein
MKITNFTKTPINAYDMLVGNSFEFDMVIDMWYTNHPQHYHVTGFASANGSIKFGAHVPHEEQVSKEVMKLM